MNSMIRTPWPPTSSPTPRTARCPRRVTWASSPPTSASRWSGCRVSDGCLGTTDNWWRAAKILHLSGIMCPIETILTTIYYLLLYPRAAAATGESLVTRTCVLEDMNSQCGQFKFQVMSFPPYSYKFKLQHCFRMTRWTAASSPATMTAVTRQREQTLSSVSKSLELDSSCAQEDRRRFNPFHAKCCFLILLIQFQPEWWMDGNGYESKMMVEWKIIGIQSITMHGEKALHFQEHLSFLFYSKIFSHFRFIDNDLDCYCSIITVSIHELFSMDIHYDIMNKSRFCWNIIFCFLFIKLSIVRKNNEDMKVKM